MCRWFIKQFLENKMSTIQQVNPNFQSKGVTKNNNIYEKTNIGKYIGVGAGAVLGGYNVYKINNALKLPDESKFMMSFVNAVISKIKEYDASAELPKSEKMIKLGKKTAYGIILAITAAIGLGIGAIGDAIANGIKAKRLDKAKQAENR